ncbi:MAG: hypothetical protein ACRDEA_19375, partial [Microcystaceae cyanobacterium]
MSPTPEADEPQQMPININNTGSCCDTDRAISTTSELTDMDAVALNSVAPKHRGEGQELVERLTQVAQDTPENLEDILIVYVEYARLLLQAQTWVWQALESWVKDVIVTRFPEYYQRLSLAIPQNENSIISSAEKNQPELSSPSSPAPPASPASPAPPAPPTSPAPTQSVAIALDSIPQEHREGIRDVCTWLAEACSQTHEHLRDFLE